MLCDALEFRFFFIIVYLIDILNSSMAVFCGLVLLHAVFESRVPSSLKFHFKECKTSVGTASEHSCLRLCVA